jgi:hypothetical protein
MIEVQGGAVAAATKRSSSTVDPPRAKPPARVSLLKTPLRAYYPETLRTKTLGVLTTVEEVKDPEMSEPILSANQRGRQAFLNSRPRTAASLHTQAA